MLEAFSSCSDKPSFSAAAVVFHLPGCALQCPVAFGGTAPLATLTAGTYGFDVGRVGAVATNNALSFAPGTTSVAGAVVANVTGGNGYTLALGTVSNASGTTSFTVNANTANATLGGYTSANTAVSTLGLGGTILTGTNAVTGVIDNGLTTSTATTGVAVLKTGPSTWTLAGANSYTGATTVREGTLTLSGNRTAAAGAITVSDQTTNATLNVQAGNFTMATDFRVGNSATATAVGTGFQTGGNITFTAGNALLVGGVSSVGVYNLSGGTVGMGFTSATRGLILGVNAGCNGTINLSGTGNLAMATGALQVGRSDSAALNSTGAFNQTGGSAAFGTIAVGGSGTIANTGTTATLNLTGGTFTANGFTALAAAGTNNATITIGGTAQVTLPAFPTLRGAGSTARLTFDGGTLTPFAPSAAYLSGLTNAYLTANGAKFNVPAGFDITIAQLLENAPSQAGTLTKSNAGTLTLTGASTYTGSTIVSAGGVVVNGSIAGPATVGVATLGGTGSIAGLLTVGGSGTVVGGDGITTTGSLSAGGFSLSAGSVIKLAIGPTFSHSSLVSTAGTSTFAPNQTFTFVDNGAEVGTYENVIVGLSNNPGTGGWAITNPGFVGTFTFDGANVDLNLTAVPEPAAVSLLAVGAIGLLARRRRRHE